MSYVQVHVELPLLEQQLNVTGPLPPPHPPRTDETASCGSTPEWAGRSEADEGTRALVECGQVARNAARRRGGVVSS